MDFHFKKCCLFILEEIKLFLRKAFVTTGSDPEFFNAIGSGVCEFLDAVRSNFHSDGKRQ